MILMIKYTLIYAVVLTLVALGGCFSEHSGIINIALEGIMVIGSVTGIIVMKLMPAGAPLWLCVLVPIVAAAAAGTAYSTLLAVSSIHLKANQTIGGTALNILANALALVIVKRFNNAAAGSQSPKLDFSNSAFLFQVGPLTLNYFLILCLILLAVSFVLLYRTRLGLRLRACGENPHAADSVGIHVAKMQWAGVLISGFLAGIGGLAYVVSSVQSWNFEVGVAGMGFLALAVMIFGQWNPVYIALAAVFFAVFRALSDIYDSIPLLSSLHLTKEIYKTMPFIASMIILTFTSRKNRCPKAEGIPYDKSQR